MAFKPRAPKPITEREFTDVNFVYGESWTWQIPSYFTLGEISKLRQIPYTHAHNWLTAELNKTQTIKSDDPPSQIEQQAAQMILQTLAKQQKDTKIVPSDDMLNSVVNRFFRDLGINQWSDDVIKEQLDIICIPTKGAPKLSTVFDKADKELMQDAINFFYESLQPSKKPKGKQSQSSKDSGKSENSSESEVSAGLSE